MKIICKLLLASACVFHFETALGDQNRPMQIKIAQSSAPLRVTSVKDLRQTPDFQKALGQLKGVGTTNQDLGKLGPGVTGGGDSCEQQIAYAFAFLKQLVAQNKISLVSYGVSQDVLKTKLNQAVLSFGNDLNVNRPVEMVNVPPENRIVVDRKVCETSFEPLFRYTPLFLHEAVRLVHLVDGPDYHISNQFQQIIRNEISKFVNTSRHVRIFTEGAMGSVALAWGIKGQNINFEDYDNLTREQEDKFYEDNIKNIENYVVDLKTMRIILIARQYSPGDFRQPQAELTDYLRWANHDDLGLLYDSSSAVGMTIRHGNWGDEIEFMFAWSPGNGGAYGVSNERMQEVVLKEAYKVLTPEQKALIAKGETSTNQIRLVDNLEGPYYAKKWMLTIGSIDRNDWRYPGHNFTAPMEINFTDGKFVIKIDKFKEVKE